MVCFRRDEGCTYQHEEMHLMLSVVSLKRFIFALRYKLNFNLFLLSMKNVHTLKEWLLAARPWSFPASTMPVLVTLAYLFWLGEDVNWINGIWALINIIFFHAAGNTWSDYADFKGGVDAEDTFGARTLVSGEFKPQEMKCYALILLSVALLGGVGLMIRTGWPLLWFGLGGLFCTLLYPPLKFRAWGDVVIAVAYAWLPSWGTSYAAIGRVEMSVLWFALPIGMITVAILHANNTRDVRTDARAHITTLAMKLGENVSRVLYNFWVLAPFAVIILCVALGVFPIWSLLACLALPAAFANVRCSQRLQTEGVAAISSLDEMSAKLQLLFSLLLSISFFLAHFLS